MIYEFEYNICECWENNSTKCHVLRSTIMWNLVHIIVPIKTGITCKNSRCTDTCFSWDQIMPFKPTVYNDRRNWALNVCMIKSYKNCPKFKSIKKGEIEEDAATNDSDTATKTAFTMLVYYKLYSILC